jgi:hypothetical protein
MVSLLGIRSVFVLAAILLFLATVAAWLGAEKFLASPSWSRGPAVSET